MVGIQPPTTDVIRSHYFLELGCDSVIPKERKVIMRKGVDLWDSFKRLFLVEVREFNDEERKQFWSSRPSRTSMYRDRLLPRIADGLKLEYKPESSENYFRIDGLYADPDCYGVPQIWIEVENDPKSSEREMDKLCYVRSPLKVLITVDRWPDDHLKAEWLRYIRETWSCWPESTDTVYGFIVGEAKNSGDGGESLFFHLFSVSADGNAAPEEEELVGGFPP